MDNITYLYNLTLSNYIESEEILADPIFETILINFVSSNMGIMHSYDLIHSFIIFLHYELDCLFYRYPKSDSKAGVRSLFFLSSANTRSRLKSETKKFSKKIKETYIHLVKEQISK